MLDQKIMTDIVNHLSPAVTIPLLICDTTGNICASTDPSRVGHMQLLAIEALNANSKITNLLDNGSSGAAVPLTYNKHRIGALVLENAFSLDSVSIEILKKSIEWIYTEKVNSAHTLLSSSEKDQYLFEWLQQRDHYSLSFLERGKKMNIGIDGDVQVILIELKPKTFLSDLPLLQNIAGKDSYVITADPGYKLVVFHPDSMFEHKLKRIRSLYRDCCISVSDHQKLLHTAYDNAMRSLKLGKALFPDEMFFTYEQMELALSIAKISGTALSTTFQELMEKGKNAHLDETVIAYLQYNGDISRVCEALHIHRNSIPYRIKKIAAICGRDLGNYYDLLYLYASYISYTLNHRI